jgi:hypothetical protein
VPEGQACDWVSNCGCAADQSCSAEGGIRSCRSVGDTTVAPYAGCVADVECPAGYSCISGNCMQHCEANSECPGEAAVCFNFADTEAVFNGFCSYNCDVLSPEFPDPGFQPCAPGLTCDILVFDETLFTACFFPGTVPEGGDCSTESCETGLACIGSICSRFCEIGTSCGDVDCTGIDPPSPEINGRVVGFCPVEIDDEE